MQAAEQQRQLLHTEVVHHLQARDTSTRVSKGQGRRMGIRGTRTPGGSHAKGATRESVLIGNITFSTPPHLFEQYPIVVHILRRKGQPVRHTRPHCRPTTHRDHGRERGCSQSLRTFMMGN